MIIAIIHNQELLPQPSNKLPNPPQLEPKELHPFPPKQKMINKAIITIHKQLSCKNLKSSMIKPPIYKKVNTICFLI